MKRFVSIVLTLIFLSMLSLPIFAARDVHVIITDADGYFVSGAKYRIYDAPTGGNEIPVVWEYDPDTYDSIFRPAEYYEDGGCIENYSEFVIKDLSTGTYYLEEIETPAGYNKLTGRVEFTVEISDTDLQIVYNTGHMLPETGRIGPALSWIGLLTIIIIIALIILIGLPVIMIIILLIIILILLIKRKSNKTNEDIVGGNDNETNKTNGDQI